MNTADSILLGIVLFIYAWKRRLRPRPPLTVDDLDTRIVFALEQLQSLYPGYTLAVHTPSAVTVYLPNKQQPYVWLAPESGRIFLHGSQLNGFFSNQTWYLWNRRTMW